MKKMVSVLLGIVITLSLLLSGSVAEADKPYAGTTISVLGNSSPASTFMQENLEKFEAETGIHVNYEQLTNDQLNTKILASMAAGGADLDAYMFMAYQNTKLYVGNGWLEPLDSYLTPEFDIGDFMKGCVDASSVNGSLYGIPHGSEYGIVFYNKTMLAEAGVDPSAIKTYEDLLEACKTVEEKLPGVHGIALRGQGNGAVTIAINLARAYGGDYLNAEGKAAINTPEFCKGIEMYRNLLQYAQEGASTMSWSETCNVFAQKQTAFRIDSDAQYTYLIDPASSLVKEDEIGFMPLPAGDACATTTLGNWSIGISYGSKHKEATWEFVRWMNDKDSCLRAVLEDNANPARSSVLASEEVKAMFPEGYTDTSIASGAIAGSGPLPNMIYSTEARTAIGEAYDAIFAGGDIQSNMDAANATMQELLDQEAAETAD